MPLLVGNGVACFSCMHTIRAEAGLCLLVPAMFARVMVFIICLFLFGVYRDQNTGGEVRHMSLSLRNLVPTPILSHTLHLQAFLTLRPYIQLRIDRRELQFSKQSRLLPHHSNNLIDWPHYLPFSSPLGTSLFLHICTLDVSVYFVHY